jgi:hypothetical protein
MTTDRGRAALAERLHKQRDPSNSFDPGRDGCLAWAAAILGEHGEFLPDGRAGLRAILRSMHEEVCACPFDGSDPGCNFTLNGTLLAALVVTPSPAGEGRRLDPVLLLHYLRRFIDDRGPCYVTANGIRQAIPKRFQPDVRAVFAALAEAAALPVHGRPEEEA